MRLTTFKLACFSMLFTTSLAWAATPDTSKIETLEQSAEQGDAQAQFELGAIYANGDGVDQSDERAYGLFDASAKQGHPGAQLSLGFMFANGSFVAKNIPQAYVWGSVVSLNGMDGTVVTDVLKSQYPDLDFKTLEQKAQTCVESKYLDCDVPPQAK